jgi:hypothetical protein
LPKDFRNRRELFRNRRCASRALVSRPTTNLLGFGYQKTSSPESRKRRRKRNETFSFPGQQKTGDEAFEIIDNEP